MPMMDALGWQRACGYLLLGLCIALTLTRTATAEEPAASCAERQGSSHELRCQFETQLGAIELPPAWITAPLTSDVAIAGGHELALALARKLAGAAKLRQQPGTALDAYSFGRAAGGFVYLRPSLRAGLLRVHAEVFTIPRGFWARAREPKRLIGRALAVTAVDAEVGEFLPRPKLALTRSESIPFTQGPVLALACGARDSAVGTHVIAATRQALLGGELDAGVFKRTHELAWSELSGIAPVPLRTPLLTFDVWPRHHWRVGSSDREHMLSFGSDFKLRERVSGLLPWPGGGCTRRLGLGLSGERAECTASKPRERSADATVFDTIAGVTLIDMKGEARFISAGRVVNSSLLRVHDPASDGSAPAHAELSDVGAQVALADLDRDGQAEVIVSRATLKPEDDAITVYSLLKGGKLSQRFRLPVPGGVQAIAACEPDGPGMSPLLIATANQLLWVH